MSPRCKPGRAVASALGGVAIALLAAAAYPMVGRAVTGHGQLARLERAERLLEAPSPLATACPAAFAGGPAPAVRAQRLGPLLASWRTVGGCGAGASAGGAGVKWVGRNVTGGLFQVQCQGNYVRQDDGYTYSLNTLVNRDLGHDWNLGVNVPYLYKYWRDPYGLGFDLSNQGWGDVGALLTRRLGPVNATSVTLSLGLPTGGHAAKHNGSVLRQDKQMGHGKYTGGLIVDHTIDNLWGLVVLGGTVDYRGGENELKSYRAPVGTVYSYAAYMLGRFAPAAGLTVSGFAAEDKDQGRAQELPRVTIAANASLEWVTDWFALLAGASIPFDTKGSLQPWIAGLGLSLAPF